mgnify:CR=1 FL=1
MKHFRSNKGFQATAHKLSLCDRLRTLQSYIVLPVGRRLNPDVGIRKMSHRTTNGPSTTDNGKSIDHAATISDRARA